MPIIIVDPSFHDEHRAVLMPSFVSAEEWLVTISQVNRKLARRALHEVKRDTPMHVRSESGETISITFR